MVRHKKIILFCGLFSLFFLIAGSFVFARQLEVEYPKIEGIKPEVTTIGLPEYVKYIFNFSLGLAGIIVFGVLFYAGFRFFTSAGDPGRMKDAKDRIKSAFLGLVVLLLSYLILTTINPELVFIKLPGRTVAMPEPLLEPIVPQPGLLSYTEIPIGGIIEQLFLEARLGRIKNISEDLMKQAEKVKNLSAELKALTDACSCSIVDKGTCEAGSCGGASECTNNCYCQGEPYSGFDPCSDRGAIDAKREELKSENKVLAGWQKKFQKELDDFRTLYNNLLAGEKKIKGCADEIGKTGSPKVVFGYNEFWVYRQKLEDDKLITGVSPERPFLPVTSEGLYKYATFYCSETPNPAVQLDYKDIEIPDFEEETGVIPREGACEKEIPIGETTDNAEELAKRMLTEMEIINDNASGEISNADILAELPPGCTGSNCSSAMPTGRSCCESKCTGCNPPPLPPPEQPPSSFFIQTAYADCEFGCASYACVRDACTSCDCTCGGSPCPAGIGSAVSAIISHYNKIVEARQKLVDLIEERVDDNLKISNILNILRAAQGRLEVCYNPRERYVKLEQSKSTTWEQLYDCSYIKESFKSNAPFYSEEGDEIRDCYGPTESSSGLMDNMFCCYYEISF